ncbi:hypothetical protein L915_16999 [Phytophthora nicotianae]|uniref:Kazal-like domain-containing protein n=3 Tax=Phytophthora nicotianae TaxID=4792 RepID=W2G2X2_PHYNI|nr:hypothetical protein L915_16999 [Phytophthora nicotianae]
MYRLHFANRESRVVSAGILGFLAENTSVLSCLPSRKMKPNFGIMFAAIAFTVVHAGNSLKGSKLKDSAVDSNFASNSGESWDFTWDASGSGNGYKCDAICPTDYEPICGSDGVTYTNDCAFGIALCKTAELSLLAVGECAGGSITSSAESSKSGSIATACPDACLDVYDPVSDESGKTYSNECYMRMAKCKNQKKDVDILAEYKRLYGRSFGASRDDSAGDDSASKESSMKGTKAPKKSDNRTKSSKASKSTKTPSASASGIGSLYKDGSDGVSGSGNSTSSKNCAGACPDIYSPVCGSDGVTYSSSCHLELASCKNPKLKLAQASEDSCAGSATTTSQQQTISDKTSKPTKTTTV